MTHADSPSDAYQDVSPVERWAAAIRHSRALVRNSSLLDLIAAALIAAVVLLILGSIGSALAAAFSSPGAGVEDTISLAFEGWANPYFALPLLAAGCLAFYAGSRSCTSFDSIEDDDPNADESAVNLLNAAQLSTKLAVLAVVLAYLCLAGAITTLICEILMATQNFRLGVESYEWSTIAVDAGASLATAVIAFVTGVTGWRTRGRYRQSLEN
jgi:hypothetical protein